MPSRTTRHAAAKNEKDKPPKGAQPPALPPGYPPASQPPSYPPAGYPPSPYPPSYPPTGYPGYPPGGGARPPTGPPAPPPKKRTPRAPKKKKAPPLIELTLDQKLDILGALLFFGGLIILLTMLTGTPGSFTRGLLEIFSSLFGWGMYPLPFGMGVLGVWLLVRHFGDRLPRLAPERVLGALLVWLAALPTLHMLTAPWYTNTPAELAARGLGGGFVGYGIQQVLISWFDASGATVALIAWWVIALALMLGTTVAQMALNAWRTFKRLRGIGRARPVTSGDIFATPLPPARIIGTHPPDEPTRTTDIPATPRGPLRLPIPLPRTATDAPADQAAPAAASPAPATNAPEIFSSAVIIGAEQPWELPKLADVLEEGVSISTNDDFDRQRADIIQHTLASFGVPVTVTGCNRGPAITQFEVKPGFIEGRGGKSTKVKVSRIAGLADDLALALAAPSIRIEAPIPGRDVVGVEVPNERTEIVALRDVMESENFERIRAALAIGLGADVSGQAVCADLGRMPHLLIAGTTGSGKSVCVNTIISCLLMRNTPDNLKMIMVDPKRVELTNYNGIPHLIAPVVVDLDRVVGVLQWVAKEMDERYRKFAKNGARNLEDYNTKTMAKGEPRMPFIVVIIDELADLMMMAPEEIEKLICRLAQMARATGIHLMLATQRPSVDVITGLIKANFPARIAFAVASSVDSRVILDGPGAERLLGRGDMLFMSPEAGQPLRIQGCWVSDREINRLVRYWKNARGLEGHPAGVGVLGVLGEHAPVSAVQPPLWEDLQAAEKKADPDGDELFEDAVSVVRSAGKASISLLQRRLRIGYTRAARLIDLLEEKGVIGPPKEGATPRDVFPPRTEFAPGAPPAPRPTAPTPSPAPRTPTPGAPPTSTPTPPAASPTPPAAPRPTAPTPPVTPPATPPTTPASTTTAPPPVPPLRGPRPLGQNPPKSKPTDVPPWVD